MIHKTTIHYYLLQVGCVQSGFSLLYRGSYMSAHVLLNLLNELGKR